LHRIDPAAENGSDSAGMSTTAMMGSPSMPRKTRTLATSSDVGSSPTQSPFQSPKMKNRSCHHHHHQKVRPAVKTFERLADGVLEKWRQVFLSTCHLVKSPSNIFNIAEKS
jgi:hypothetical protein